MALELQSFASGDTDYIAKLNQNSTELIAAINALQTQVGAVAGGDALSLGLFFGSLFNYSDSLIGPTSYTPQKSGTTLTVATGGMYLANEQEVVTSFNPVSINFGGLAAATYYIVVGASGIPGRQATNLPGTIYSVDWNGSAFGDLVYIAGIFYDTRESDASRKSLTFGSPPSTENRYGTLDARLEAGETLAKEARAKGGEALAIAKDLQGRTGVRKIGITVDGTIGVKGAIQIDFDGTIIGWSCIADVVGSIQVEVSVKVGTVPPAAPVVPDPATDKITAAAPITLATAQSASSGTAGVSTWTTALARWSTVQFRVASAVTVARVTLYLRVQEIIPVINPLPALSSSEEEAQ